MAFTIALSGKGGSGKSTLSSLIVRWLTEKRGKNVLAVDADPNYTLAAALGVDVEGTVAELREDVLKERLAVTPGMSKQRMVEYMVEQRIAEGKKFDLLTMGRPEGPECYCYVNHLLRDYLTRTAERNAYVVIDNEAGMEHLSRRTTNDVEVLFIVGDESAVSLRAVERIYELSKTLPITVKEKFLVLNRKKSDAPFDDSAFSKNGLPLGGIIPYDVALEEVFGAEKPIFELPEESPAYVAVGEMLSKIIPDK
jgi:CO dehydrogenase maturation factor